MPPKSSLPSGISQRSNGKYWVRISYEGRQVSVGLFDTLTDAKVALTLAKADAVKGMFIPPAEKRRAAREKAAAEAARTLTLGQWAHEWLATFAGFVEIGQRSKATYREYESVLGLYVLPAWAKTPLSQISPADVEKILASILARKGANTRNKVLRTIRPLFNAAVEQGAGGLDKSPVKSKPLKAVVDERATAKPEQVSPRRRHALASRPKRLPGRLVCPQTRRSARPAAPRLHWPRHSPAYAPRGTPVESENQPTRLHHHQGQRRAHHLNPH